MENESKQEAPFLNRPNGLSPSVNYPQKFIYSSPETLPKNPPMTSSLNSAEAMNMSMARFRVK